AEMVEHGMPRRRRDLADGPQEHRLGLRPLEFHLSFALIGFDAAQPFQEIDLPEGTPEFAVRNGLEADPLLLADDFDNFLVLDLPQGGRVDLTGFPSRAGLPEPGWTQKASDMIGAVRRSG